MAGLSNDAKLLAACVWGLPIGQKTELSYQRPYSIWPRTRAALSELVNEGFIRERTDERGVHFTPTLDPERLCSKFARVARAAAKRGDKGPILSAMSEDEVRAQLAAP